MTEHIPSMMLVTLMCVTVWRVDMAVQVKVIKINTKKSIRKLTTIYPYFSAPFYKKIFMRGLKGKASPIVVCFNYMYNITTFLLVGCCVWDVLFCNAISELVIRNVVGVWGILWGLHWLIKFLLPKL